MPKITEKQISNINKQCRNNWELDVQYFLFYGEKTLVKQISLDNQNYLEFTLRFNHKNQVSLHISKFYHKENENYASTSGLGKSKILDTAVVKRKNANKLIEFTKMLTDDKLIEINKNTEVSKSNGLILQSEEF